MNKLQGLYIIWIIYCSTLWFGCSISGIQKRGCTKSGTFYSKVGFSTSKTIPVLSVEIDGVTKNFLFDTGADFTLVQRDTVKGRVSEITGATNRTMKLGKEVIKSIKIGDVEFVGTYAMCGDFPGLKEQVPNFGGLIGQTIIGKANWLINYPGKTIEISSKHLVDSTFKPINITKENGSPYIYLVIDGSRCKVLLDLGSSSAFSIPENTPLADKLLNKYLFMENAREVYTIGGLQLTKEKTGLVKLISSDGIDFPDIPTSIRKTSQPRIGNDFFKDCVLYIDNINLKLWVKKAK